jgi:predicted Fe-Mo cluster-binding NifX family protein
MRVCVPVADDGSVGHGWGRAERVAVAEVSVDGVTEWQEFDVAWDASHEQEGDGAHHARMVRFLKDHEVEAVVARRMGDDMRRTLGRMGLRIYTGASGSARSAVLVLLSGGGTADG